MLIGAFTLSTRDQESKPRLPTYPLTVLGQTTARRAKTQRPVARTKHNSLNAPPAYVRRFHNLINSDKAFVTRRYHLVPIVSWGAKAVYELGKLID
jgi:hypothetical protein